VSLCVHSFVLLAYLLYFPDISHKQECLVLLPQVCLTLKLHCVICEHSDYDFSVPNKTGMSVSNSVPNKKTITVNLMPGHIRNMARAAIMNWEREHHELSQMLI